MTEQDVLIRNRRGEDARVLKTKASLRNALLSLMRTKPAGDVTITELCAKAKVNRNTFYAHYASPRDVLDELMAELGEKNAHALAVTRRHGSIAWLTELCSNIQQNKETYKLILSTEDGRAYVEQEIESAYRLVMDKTSERIRKDPAHADLFAFATGGSLAVIDNWLREGAVRAPEDMACIINSLCKRGIAGWFEECD